MALSVLQKHKFKEFYSYAHIEHYRTCRDDGLHSNKMVKPTLSILRLKQSLWPWSFNNLHFLCSSIWDWGKGFFLYIAYLLQYSVATRNCNEIGMELTEIVYARAFQKTLYREEAKAIAHESVKHLDHRKVCFISIKWIHNVLTFLPMPFE